MNTTPLESHEQRVVVEYLERQGLRFTSVPNSTFTRSWSQKRKNYLEGLRPGFSDLIVIIPPERSLDGLGYFLSIEMKRLKGSVQSKDQKQWEDAINGLNTPHVQYYLCKGSESAIKVVEHYLKDANPSPF